MLKLNNKRKVRVNKICRTCLTERGHLREIFSTKIPKMLENISSVQVAKEDGLPPNICISCFHLIAKFYTFRKKLEKNDKFLKLHCTIIEKDILDLAVSDAQIKADNDVDQNPAKEAPNISNEQMSISVEVIEEVDSPEHQVSSSNTKDESSEEDKCVLEDSHFNQRRSKEKAKKIIRSLIQEDGELDGDLLSEENTHKPAASNVEIVAPNIVIRDSTADTSDHIFSDGPPPLVPIEIEATQENKGESAGIDTQKLPDDAPPLVPIKPLADPQSILTIITPPTDLILTCPSCDEEFTTIEALKQHKLHNCQISNMQCNICKKEFKETKKLIGHLKGHMVVKEYGCKLCGKRYPNPSTFKVHMRTHTGERPFKCEVCGKGFIRWAGVAGHMRTHQSFKPYKCPTCGKGFKISSNLERHKILHSGILPYCCNYCGKTFSQSENLQLHIRTYHTKERPYLCNECGKGFVSSTRLNRHMWVHTGYKPYQCKSCPKAYSNSNDLKNHERSHSDDVNEKDKPYACEECDMRFYHPCRLNKHMKTHVRPYACSSCTKTFSCSRWLKKHMDTKHSSPENEEVQFAEEVVIKNEVFIEYTSC